MSSSFITVDFRTYLWTLSGAIILLLSGITTLNYVLDPYLIHQWNTPLINRLYPKNQKLTPWVKTYAVSRYKPEVIYLGSSRAEIGLPANVDVFAGKRVFNLAIRGGALGDSIAMLKHARVFNRPAIVVWGLDYGWLFDEGIGNTDFDRDLVAQGKFYPLWRTFLNIKRSMSMDITTDAFKHLLGLSEQSCETTLAIYGQLSASCVEKSKVGGGGPAKEFEGLMKSNPEDVKHNFDIAFQQLESITSDFCQQGTAFRFYIQPIHALKQLHQAKSWEQIEDWTRKLVNIIDQRKQTGCDIRLMDFSGFNSITTEEIPQVTGKSTMSNYWEASHYRSEVGEKILAQLFSNSPQGVESDFGVDLNGAVIEAHLAKVRQARDQYCATHPKETALLKANNSSHPAALHN